LEFIEPSSEIKLCRDPDDDKFLECAVDGFCTYIVSGDKDLLVLQNYGDIKIVKVRDFFDDYLLHK
jgi:predicted nucleic acid-binding protein